MSAGNALPAGAPPECRPVASPEPGRPGSCPRSSAYAMATWWSPFVDVPTGRFVPRRIKRIHLPANYPRSRDLTPLGGAVPSNASKWNRGGLTLRLGWSVPRCSLRGRSGARHPRHARAKERAARGSGWLRSSHPLRCAPRLWRRQVGTGKQVRRSNRKAGLGHAAKGAGALVID